MIQITYNGYSYLIIELKAIIILKIVKIILRTVFGFIAIQNLEDTRPKCTLKLQFYLY